MARWLEATPLGLPVDPDVYKIVAGSSGPTSAAGMSTGPTPASSSPSDVAPGVGRARTETTSTSRPGGGARPQGDTLDVEARPQPIQALLVREQDLRAAVPQAVFHFHGLPQRIQRHRDSADRGRGGESEHPFGVIAHGDGDAIALGHAELVLENMGDTSRRRVGLGERESFILVDEEGVGADRVQIKLA